MQPNNNFIVKKYLLYCVVLLSCLFAGCGGGSSSFESDIRKSMPNVSISSRVEKTVSFLNNIKPGNYTADKELIDLFKEESLSSVPYMNAGSDLSTEIESAFKKFGKTSIPNMDHILEVNNSEELYEVLKKYIPELIKNGSDFIRINAKMSKIKDLLYSFSLEMKDFVARLVPILEIRHSWKEREISLFKDRIKDLVSIYVE